MSNSSLDKIVAHTLKYSGHHLGDLKRCLPHCFSAIDYCLVLDASFPSSCVQFDLLCWSPSPIAAQSRENISLFIQFAQSLALPNFAFQCSRNGQEGAPFTPCEDQLLPVPENLAHHLTLQAWLYAGSRLSPPVERSTMDILARIRRVVGRFSSDPRSYQVQGEKELERLRRERRALERRINDVEDLLLSGECIGGSCSYPRLAALLKEENVS